MTSLRVSVVVWIGANLLFFALALTGPLLPLSWFFFGVGQIAAPLLAYTLGTEDA